MGFRSAGSLLSCESESAASGAGAESVECVAASSSRAMALVVVSSFISMFYLWCKLCACRRYKERRRRKRTLEK